MPDGRQLLTLSTPDKSFEAHLEVDKAVAVHLGISPKTGGPLIRVLGENDESLLVLVLERENPTVLEEFEDCRRELGGERVTLAR